MTNFDLVKTFHEKFNLVNNEVPVLIDQDTINLRLDLIWEEYIELQNELEIEHDHIDLKKVAKELADLLYVVYGTAASFGIPINDVFAEVHRSNMSKLGEDGKPVYREDGKVLKGPEYTPANLEAFFP